MLDPSHEPEVIDSLWDAAQSHTQLPADLNPAIGINGGASQADISRRAYHRFQVNRRAIMVRLREMHGVYVKDFSKGDSGFLAPMQLFPNDQVWLLLPDGGKKFLVRVRRCRRYGERCYEIGAVLAGGDAVMPSDVLELMGSGI